MKNPRKPTETEKSDLAYWVAERMDSPATDEDLEQAQGFVYNAYIAVFDNFVSECPGFFGKVMIVIWAPGPSMYEAFIWRNDKLVKLDQDT